MTFHKLIFIFIVFVTLSCKKQGPAHTRLYTEDGMEVLNGHVKEIFSGDSSVKLSTYSKYNFDIKGDMVSSKEKTIDIITTGGKTDTSIDIDKRKYAVNYNKKGFIRTIKYYVSISDTTYPHPDYSQVLEFDRRGYLATKGDPRDSVGPIVYYKCDTAGYVVNDTVIHRASHLAPDFNLYKYDNRHLLIERTEGEEDYPFKTTKFTYKAFDSNGNWIKRLCQWRSYFPGRRDSGIYIEIRKITYY